MLDAALADIDGFEVVAQLRDTAARATPLVVHTALSLTADDRDRLRLGPTLHEPKSLDSAARVLELVRTRLADLL